MNITNKNIYNRKLNNPFDRISSKDIMNRKRINIIDFKYKLSNIFNHNNDNCNKININPFNKRSPQLLPLNNLRQRYNNQKWIINKENEISEYKTINNKNSNYNNKINVHISIDSISKQRKLPFISKLNEHNNNSVNVEEIIIGENNKNNLEINSGYINKNNINSNTPILNAKKLKIKKNYDTIYSIKKKINIDCIKNINRKKIILTNDDEKIVNIRMKANQNSNYYKNYNNNNNQIIFKSKKENVQFCISHFANFSNDLMSMKCTLNHFENQRNNNNDKLNKLNKNKTIFGKKNKFLENEENEGEDVYYKSKYFLPSSGFGLLSKTNFKSKV